MKGILRQLVLRVLNYIAPEPPSKCETCGWNVHYHKPDCPVPLPTLTLEDWRKRAEQYYADARRSAERHGYWIKEAHRWEGKFHTVCRENNALRKRNRKLEKEHESPRSA